jgi:ferritin-like metal-binding protein YciE
MMERNTGARIVDPVEAGEPANVYRRLANFSAVALAPVEASKTATAEATQDRGGRGRPSVATHQPPGRLQGPAKREPVQASAALRFAYLGYRIEMPKSSACDAELIQYLNEAYSVEREAETVLAAHIAIDAQGPYRKRLLDHLVETQAHGREVNKRILQLGGRADAGPLAEPVSTDGARPEATEHQATSNSRAQTNAPPDAVDDARKSSKALENPKAMYFRELEEIAIYTAIDTLAEALGDYETANLARKIRRDEELMATFLERHMVSQTRAVTGRDASSERRRTPPPGPSTGRQATHRSASSDGS